MTRLPLSWAMARGRDALESTHRFRDQQEIDQDKQAVIVLNTWLERQDARLRKKKEELLCTRSIHAPAWSGLTCDHPKSQHDRKTGKCSGIHEFGWGDHPCDCTGFTTKEEK